MEQQHYGEQKERIIDIIKEWNIDCSEHAIFNDYTLMALFAEYLLRNTVRVNTDERTYIPMQDVYEEIDYLTEGQRREPNSFDEGFDMGMIDVKNIMLDVCEEEFEL